MFWLATFTFSLFPSPYSYFLERSATLRKRVAHISFMLKKIGAFVCTTNILLQKTIRMCLRLVFSRAFKLHYVLQVPNFSCHLYSMKISHASSLLLIFSTSHILQRYSHTPFHSKGTSCLRRVQADPQNTWMKEKELEISRLSIGCVPKQTFVFLRNGSH